MSRPIRIGHIGPVATTIPAPKNGSVELVTALLTDELVARGHDVTLFSTGRTQTKAKLHATFPAGYTELPNVLWPWEMCELMNLAAACERWREFDVLHYQGAYYPMSIAFSKMVGVPMVQTLHHQPYSAQVAMWGRYPDTHYVAISNYQASALTGLNSVTTVLHGVDTSNFPFGDQPEDYMVFLGRFTPGKGVLEAIDIARRTQTKLLMAAPECDYFRTTIRPHVDGKLIQYVGELDFRDKTRLLKGARALLYPIQEGEPFGLVLVEAMACGTPVVALNRGAVPEIVRDGVSGYLFETLDDLAAGIARVDGLDRAAVRRDAVERFDVSIMVDGYEALYRRLVDGQR